MNSTITPREVIYRIKATYKEHKGNSVLFNAHVWNVFYTALKRTQQDNKELKRILRPDFGLQSKTINMIEVTGNLLGLPDCSTLCKSVEKISDTAILDSIFTLDLISPVKIEYVSFKDYLFKTKIKLPFKLKVAFIYEEYLYSTVCYPQLNIKGTFDTQDGNVGVCGFLDEPIGAQDYLIENAINMTLREFNIFKQLPYNRPEEKLPNSIQ